MFLIKRDKMKQTENIHHNYTLSEILFKDFNIFHHMSVIEFSTYDLSRNIKIPEKSNELSEFLGILMGDGYLIDRGRIHKFDITLNLKEDKEYVFFVINLIKGLFNVIPSTLSRPSQNTFDILVNSKIISKFLLSQEFPNGFKKNMKVPNWILEKKQFMYSFLRGLVDTDGSLFFAKRGTYKSNKYPVIEIKTYDKFLLDEVFNMLSVLNFNPIKQECKIQLNGVERLNKWLKEIGFKNLNHLSRYYIWKKFGFCPPNTNLKNRLKLLGRRGRTAMRPISRGESRLQN